MLFAQVHIFIHTTVKHDLRRLAPAAWSAAPFDVALCMFTGNKRYNIVQFRFEKKKLRQIVGRYESLEVQFSYEVSYEVS